MRTIWLKSLSLSATILLGQLWCAAPALGADAALQLGRELAALGSYDQAITEYKRFVCFSTDAAAMGRAGRKRYLQNFSYNAFLYRFSDQVRSLLC